RLCFATTFKITTIQLRLLRHDGGGELFASLLIEGESDMPTVMMGAAPGSLTMDKVNLAEKFARISEFYKPHVAGELNGQQVKLVKTKGEFVFHHHDHEDEMFLVVKGRFRMEFRDRHEWIEEGEFIVVPRGVEHRPVAPEECWLLLFEPAGTLNTGNVVNERTHRELDRV